MSMFKVGDKVKVVGGYCSLWEDSSIDKKGVILDEHICPTVKFPDGSTDCGEEEYLELVKED